jgi:transcriptional regulator with XRE-family HTH domain
MKKDISGEQLRAARAMLGWSMTDLAERAGQGGIYVSGESRGRSLRPQGGSSRDR